MLLAFSTADLRFPSNLNRALMADCTLAGAEWRAWRAGPTSLRPRFKALIMSFLAVGKSPDSKAAETASPNLFELDCSDFKEVHRALPGFSPFLVVEWCLECLVLWPEAEAVAIGAQARARPMTATPNPWSARRCLMGDLPGRRMRCREPSGAPRTGQSWPNRRRPWGGGPSELIFGEEADPVGLHGGAIGDDGGPADVAGGGGAQEQHHGSHFVDRAHANRRTLGDEFVGEALLAPSGGFEFGAHHAWRGEDAGSEGVDGHTALHEIGGQRLDQVDHPRPSRTGVGEHRRAALKGERVHHIDDGPESLVGHRPHETVGHVPGAVEIEIDHGPPSVVGDGAGKGWKLAAGVVDQEVGAAERVIDGAAQGIDLIDLSDVG